MYIISLYRKKYSIYIITCYNVIRIGSGVTWTVWYVTTQIASNLKFDLNFEFRVSTV